MTRRGRSEIRVNDRVQFGGPFCSIGESRRRRLATALLQYIWSLGLSHFIFDFLFLALFQSDHIKIFLFAHVYCAVTTPNSRFLQIRDIFVFIGTRRSAVSALVRG